MLQFDRLAVTGGALLNQGQRDGPPEIRAEIAGSHETDAGLVTILLFPRMSPRRQRGLAVRHDQADKLVAVGAFRILSEQRTAADIFCRAFQTRPGDPEIVRHGSAVRILADNDVTLLSAKDHQRLKANGDCVELLAGLLQPGPQPVSAVCPDGEFVATVAGEADTGYPQFGTLKAAMPDRHMRQGFVVQG